MFASCISAATVSLFLFLAMVFMEDGVTQKPHRLGSGLDTLRHLRRWLQ